MSDRTPLQRMQAGADPATLYRHLEWFSKVDRDTGGEGEDRAAEYLAAERRAGDGPRVRRLPQLPAPRDLPDAGARGPRVPLRDPFVRALDAARGVTRR